MATKKRTDWTTTEIAREIDRTDGRVRQIVTRLGLGRLINRRLRLLTDDDVNAIRRCIRPEK